MTKTVKKDEGQSKGASNKTAPAANAEVKKIAEESKSQKHPGGRPPKYSTLAELESIIEAYFIWCDKNVYPYTITGLAMALGLTRRGLLDYEDKPEFSHAVKQAKLKCRWYVEKELFLGKNQSAMIFWLKNNDDWKDSQQLEHTGQITYNKINIEVVRPG